MVIGANERSWSVDVPFDHFGQKHSTRSGQIGQKGGFHRKYILNLQKPIPLRVWGRLGPVRVSQILPCFLRVNFEALWVKSCSVHIADYPSLLSGNLKKSVMLIETWMKVRSVEIPELISDKYGKHDKKYDAIKYRNVYVPFDHKEPDRLNGSDNRELSVKWRKLSGKDEITTKTLIHFFWECGTAKTIIAKCLQMLKLPAFSFNKWDFLLGKTMFQ